MVMSLQLYLLPCLFLSLLFIYFRIALHLLLSLIIQAVPYYTVYTQLVITEFLFVCSVEDGEKWHFSHSDSFNSQHSQKPCRSQSTSRQEQPESTANRQEYVSRYQIVSSTSTFTHTFKTAPVQVRSLTERTVYYYYAIRADNSTTKYASELSQLHLLITMKTIPCKKCYMKYVLSVHKKDYRGLFLRCAIIRTGAH